MKPHEMAVNDSASHAASSKYTLEQIASSNLSSAKTLPLLSEAPVAPVPLSIQYWSPETEGEFKRGWVVGIGMQEVSDLETSELKMLESLFFVEQGENGQMIRWFNSSKILVANIKDAISRGELVPNTTLTPVQITYIGLKKNSKNAFKSKRFEILPLIVSALAA